MQFDKKDSMEVVAVFLSVADAGSDGVHVLQYGAVLDARNVGTHRRMDIVVGNLGGEVVRLVQVRRGQREVGETFESYLLGMTRSADNEEVLVGHAVALMEIFGDGEVLVGHDAFDGAYPYLIAHVDAELGEVRLEIGRGA
jgi:hypothetical protein